MHVCVVDTQAGSTRHSSLGTWRGKLVVKLIAVHLPLQPLATSLYEHGKASSVRRERLALGQLDRAQSTTRSCRLDQPGDRRRISTEGVDTFLICATQETCGERSPHVDNRRIKQRLEVGTRRGRLCVSSIDVRPTRRDVTVHRCHCDLVRRLMWLAMEQTRHQHRVLARANELKWHLHLAIFLLFRERNLVLCYPVCGLLCEKQYRSGVDGRHGCGGVTIKVHPRR